MNQRLREYAEKWVRQWQQLDAKRRRWVVVGAGLAVVLLVALTWYALTPRYVVVFENLDAKAAGEVTNKLEELKIPYRTSGGQVLVPEQDADRARMQLAIAGLPKSGYIGYQDLFGNTSIGGMSDNEFNIKTLMALEGSLAGTIRQIDGVEDVKVHLVMPEQHLFVEQPTGEAKASVFVKMAPGARLSGEQVAGIQQLVSHSVKGLKPTDVAVVDQNGVRLDNADEGRAAVGTADKQIQIKKQYEQMIADRLQAALQRMVGPGNAVVTVNAVLNFDQVKSTENEVRPVVGQSGLPISVQKSNKTGTGTTPGGVPGTTTAGGAGPGAPQTYQAVGGGTSNYEENQQTINYEVTRIVTERVGQPFVVQDLTVSVLVNGNANDRNQIEAIRNYVLAAVGYPTDGSMNNKVNVTAWAFRGAPAEAEPWWRQYAWLLALGAVAAAAGVYAWFRRRRRKEEVQPVPEAPAVPSLLEETKVPEAEQRRREVEQLAKTRPKEFAELLRTWLAEE
ncbi:MAG: flagellar basal-body MS-ring/collar protein FliF [Alicyclobacillaceae bacterium]|nr:flagellar basal-body MS-ring/collar protein FliF [Alicyclobacillaceae bacterium]